MECWRKHTGVPAPALQGGPAESGELHLRCRGSVLQHACQQHELGGVAQSLLSAGWHAVRHVRLCVLQV